MIRSTKAENSRKSPNGSGEVVSDGLAGLNDMRLLEATNVGREINRHYYSWDEVPEALARPAVQDLLKLIHFRNEHPAFQGTFSTPESNAHVLVIHWSHAEVWAELVVDFVETTMDICYLEDGVEKRLQFITKVA